MSRGPPFYSLPDQLKLKEEKQFRLPEMQSTKSIVKKVIKAFKARRPNLHYTAHGWQGLGSSGLIKDLVL